MRRFVLGLAWLLIPCAVSAQPVDEARWVPNGPVFAVAQHDGITYVGGQFTIVSPPSGAGAPINVANDVIPIGFPAVVGRVFTAVSDGAGGWYIGGLFTHVGGLPRNNIARIASDLSVHPWNPNANGAVLAITIPSAGTIYVGGDFSTIGGLARARLAELDVNTGNATSMSVGTNSIVRALANSGSVMYVGGDFTFAGVSPRSRLCAIDTATRTLTAWNPGANGTVNALEVVVHPGPTVSVLVGGSFGTLGGLARANLGEVSTFGVTMAWNPSPNGAVRDIHEQVVDYIAGDFTTIGGQPRNHVAAYDNTGILNAWNPNVDGPVEALAWSSNNVFVGGTFTTVGGLPRRNVAKIDQATGIPAAWDPQPNNTVHALAPGITKMYAGGEFTGFGGVERRNLAAFDDWDDTVTSWDPGADGVVRALALNTFGPVLYSVYAGGDFSTVHGQSRGHMAAIHPKTGIPTSWVGDADSTVWAITTNDTMVVFAGKFAAVNGTPADRLAARRHDGGPVITFGGFGFVGFLFALGMDNLTLTVGGQFAWATYSLDTKLRTSVNTPALNGAVRAVYMRSGSAYLGGDFTMAGATPRPHLARVTTANGALEAWNPGADGIVRAIIQGEAGVLVGGDFLNAGGAPRARFAEIDQTTGLAQAPVADASDLEVWALAASGPYTRVGGRFHGIGGIPAAGFAALGPPRIAACSGPPLFSFAGGRPTALTVLDANADGIQDLAVCHVGVNPHVLIMKGIGNGSFQLLQTLNPATTPKDVVAADFDLDGLPDLAVSESDDIGTVSLFHNVAGAFEPWTSVPMLGRIEGLDVGDYDADGIFDIVVCQIDSASVIRKGGLEILRGGGTGGMWDGTFTPFLSPVWFPSTLGRRVAAHDYNQDGWIDFVYTGPGSFYIYHGGPGGIPTCHEGLGVGNPQRNSGVAIVAGDFNDDGRTDVAVAFNRNLQARFKNTATTCVNWFPTSGGFSITPLPSTPRDLAVIDLDQDGILDILCTFDSLNTIGWCRGNGTAGVGDGSFQPPLDLDLHDVYRIGLGDFVADGTTDIVTTMQTCGQVGVTPNGSLPLFPITIGLTSPNGGEGWSQAAFAPPPVETQAIALSDEDALAPVPVALNAAPPARLQSSQTIAWTKGDGISSVDVEVSRNDGVTWRPIGKNMPGTSMNWIVTPPGSALARVRVRDSAYPARVDASDAPFTVFAGVIGAEPPGAPLRSGLHQLGRNPARGAVKFALDVASPVDVAVVLYDAAGRRVRVIAQGNYRAGTHELAWDGRDASGTACRSGVYFVKARIGAVESKRKVVML